LGRPGRISPPYLARSGRSRWGLRCVARCWERRWQATRALLVAPRLPVHPAAWSRGPASDAGDRDIAVGLRRRSPGAGQRAAIHGRVVV